MKALMLTLALTLSQALPAAAAGPFDGVWHLVETHPGHGTVTYFASAHHNDTAPPDASFVMIFVDEFGFWSYGIGSLQENSFSGVAIDPVFGTEIGHFELVFSGTTVTGSGNLLGTSAGLVPISGARIF